MESKLSFIVFGVPRSGTSVLARSLSLRKECFCSVEFYSMFYDFGTIRLPDSLINDRRQSPNVLNSRKELEKKDIDGIKFWGDKLPRYYLVLDSINRASEGLKNIYIFRDLCGVTKSWDTRADNPNDDRWHRGQGGIFAIIESFISLYRVVNSPYEGYFVNYSNLFFDDPEIINQIYVKIGCSEDMNDRDRFMKTFFRAIPRKDDNVLSEKYQEVSDMLDLNDLENIFSSSKKIRSFIEVKDEVNEYILPRLSIFQLALTKYLEKNERERLYFPIWYKGIFCNSDNKSSSFWQDYDIVFRSILGNLNDCSTNSSA